MSRELTSLYLENQEIPVILDQFQAKPKFGVKAERWAWRGFKSSARGDDLVLYHWAKAAEQCSDYFYARYNSKTKLLKYADEEYLKHIEQLDGSWSRVETDYLFHMCEIFDMRFIVIHDRYYTHPDCPSSGIQPERTLEDIKDRYYAVYRVLAKLRAQKDTQDPDDLPLQATNKLADELSLLRFDKKKEQERKKYLEALFRRNKEEIDEEEMLVIEARRIEANERRLVHEREALLQSHILFDDSLTPTTSVKVQLSSYNDHISSNSTSNDGAQKTKHGSDVGDSSSQRQTKRHKSSHNTQSSSLSVRAKSTDGTSKAGTPGSSASAGSRSTTKISTPTAVASAASVSVKKRSSSPAIKIKQESDVDTLQFGPLTYSTEKHLVYPAISQVEALENTVVSVARRDTKLGPGVFLRTDKLYAIPKNKLEPVKLFMSKLSINSPNTIWPRPSMATAAVCDRFDSLQSTIIPLLDFKKTVDKLETEVHVLRARRLMLVGEIGEMRAKSILEKLPEFDSAKLTLQRSSTPLANETPPGRHNRKGSTATGRKKARD